MPLSLAGLMMANPSMIQQVAEVPRNPYEQVAGGRMRGGEGGAGGGSAAFSDLKQAANAIKSEQGGIGAVYIGDIVQRTGAPVEAVQQTLLNAAKIGKVSLHRSDSMQGLSVPGRMEAAINHPNYPDPLAVVTFK